jgi:hypothetical protein
VGVKIFRLLIVLFVLKMCEGTVFACSEADRYFLQQRELYEESELGTTEKCVKEGSVNPYSFLKACQHAFDYSEDAKKITENLVTISMPKKLDKNTDKTIKTVNEFLQNVVEAKKNIFMTMTFEDVDRILSCYRLTCNAFNRYQLLVDILRNLNLTCARGAALNIKILLASLLDKSNYVSVNRELSSAIYTPTMLMFGTTDQPEVNDAILKQFSQTNLKFGKYIKSAQRLTTIENIDILHNLKKEVVDWIVMENEFYREYEKGDKTWKYYDLDNLYYRWNKYDNCKYDFPISLKLKCKETAQRLKTSPDMVKCWLSEALGGLCANRKYIKEKHAHSKFVTKWVPGTRPSGQIEIIDADFRAMGLTLMEVERYGLDMCQVLVARKDLSKDYLSSGKNFGASTRLFLDENSGFSVAICKIYHNNVITFEIDNNRLRNEVETRETDGYTVMSFLNNVDYYTKNKVVNPYVPYKLVLKRKKEEHSAFDKDKYILTGLQLKDDTDYKSSDADRRHNVLWTITSIVPALNELKTQIESTRQSEQERKLDALCSELEVYSETELEKLYCYIRDFIQEMMRLYKEIKVQTELSDSFKQTYEEILKSLKIEELQESIY